ncbi:uridine kinase family-domain-containing protein [Phascolomyces articulosus]|uniref:uridine/cytidine kinase n=1 Tax=Phascolomyces articulosus TaxID=60185 RepID=A0AAD5PIT5_9FUNG|nr:uridine kinase family-domain-containing protein [Phascolomyces articulosus]
MSIDSTPYADPSYFKVVLQTPMIVGVAGGADAGKRNVCNSLVQRLSETYSAKTTVISLTDFYRELTEDERILYEEGRFNLDHPTAFDFDLLQEAVMSLLSGNPTTIPVWNDEHHTKVGTRLIEPVDVILVEGTLVLYPKSLRELMFMKVFIDVDSDQRLTRRVSKPNRRGFSIDKVLAEYVEFVKPMFEDFIWPTKKFADIIIPRGVENKAALKVLGNHLEDHLKKRSAVDSAHIRHPPIWNKHLAAPQQQQQQNSSTSSPISVTPPTRSKNGSPVPSISSLGTNSPDESISSSTRSNSFRSFDYLATTAESSYKKLPK